MKYNVSSLWHRLPSDIVSRTERCIATGCGQNAQRGESLIFFRADDIAAPGNQYSRLIKLFSLYKVPLCLAVVPAWLTRPRWLALKSVAKNDASLWCWHQHGWRHVNHEDTGKKQEFGASRSRTDLEHDIGCGKRRLENLLGDVFYPAFTPPWNRCDRKTLDVLKELDYAAISRSRGSKPSPPEGLLNFDVNVDLHTRKEKRPGAGWDNLFNDLQQAIGSGRCGIMIHHQLMNQAAFDFLEILLRALARNKTLKMIHFEDLL
ncbi:MAG: polysaccharide deacetylase family protein [bacterium]|nr:polysaccharide deacetylase family protein [bacterium]